MKVRFWQYLLTTVAAAFLLNGCVENPGDPQGNTLEVSPQAQLSMQVGWQAVNQMATTEEFEGMVNGQEIYSDAPQSLNTMPEIKHEIERMKNIRGQAYAEMTANKTTGDSIIWSQEWNDPISGTAGRRMAIYQPESGLGRIYEVIYQFPARVKLAYDSTEFRLYLGSSLADTSDDRLERIDKLSNFRDGFFIEQVVNEVVVTDYAPDNEVTGATQQNRVSYGAQVPMTLLTQNGEIDPDGRVTLNERLDYRDNTFLAKALTINPTGTGEYQETWRNGTRVNGTFDILEDDNHAEVTRNIIFANARHLEKIEDRATYQGSDQDSSYSATFGRKVYFRSGRLDTVLILNDHFLDGDIWNDHLHITASNAGETDITVANYEEYEEYQGYHNAEDGKHLRFHGTTYQDGSGEIWLDIYASEQAYNNGEEPLLSLHIEYNPDGSGNGEYTEDGITYQVSINAEGEVTVNNPDGQQATVSAL